MAIDRRSLVRRHNPVLRSYDPFSPLSLGNGEFAFTVDITGLQSLVSNIPGITPLCTMSQWGFHSYPEREDCSRDEKRLRLSYFDPIRKTGGYMTDPTGQEELFNELRMNPHRINLARVGFVFEGKELKFQYISDIEQILDLWKGELHSRFSYKDQPVDVYTICDPEVDVLGIHVFSPLLDQGRLAVRIAFPYGSHEIDASDWNAEKRHSTIVLEHGKNSRQENGESLSLQRILDSDCYFVQIQAGATGDAYIHQESKHEFIIAGVGPQLDLVAQFSPQKILEPPLSFRSISDRVARHWEEFWSTGGAIELIESRDERAMELERRIILSRYLTAIQCDGSYPPSETGLTCNSWYGKFHLEMHYWHAAHFIVWGKPELFERSFEWYRSILPSAKKRAQEQGYIGARWPKMTDPSGRDSPSPIGPLLCWQQPHPLMYIELLRRAYPNRQILYEYRDIIEATADFMASFAQWNESKQRYDLGPPLIPAQENHRPEDTLNPPFEVEYWRWSLFAAIYFFEMLDLPVNSKWREVASRLALLPVDKEKHAYLAHENCPKTYDQFASDHPEMLFALGMLPGPSVDKTIMSNTLDMVLKTWNLESLWGWDFPAMAMTAFRLGREKDAIDLLLMQTPKNSYRANGHNPQLPRTDLPVYLPGNGALLLAMSLMAQDWEDEDWEMQAEGLLPIP